MADEVKAPDSAQAPGASQTGSPAAPAAPVKDTAQIEVQRLQAELGIERKRREDAQKAFHRTQAELKAIQSQTGYETPDSNGRDYSGIPPEVMQATVERVGFFQLAAENQDAFQYAPQIREVLSDPDRAARYANPDPYQTFRAVYGDLKAEALARENEELKKQLESRSAARETLKTQAVASGVSASEPNTAITREDIDKMTVAEMEQKFGKAALLNNILR